MDAQRPPWAAVLFGRRPKEVGSSVRECFGGCPASGSFDMLQMLRIPAPQALSSGFARSAVTRDGWMAHLCFCATSLTPVKPPMVQVDVPLKVMRDLLSPSPAHEWGSSGPDRVRDARVGN
ncbi:hypothetical protein LZ30DRAFT_108404 [Colletotrichum cereale]|nr:hypothetical protein LZ30DRAFT_108404 [Colletotrichum cereale]